MSWASVAGLRRTVIAASVAASFISAYAAPAAGAGAGAGTAMLPLSTHTTSKDKKEESTTESSATSSRSATTAHSISKDKKEESTAESSTTIKAKDRLTTTAHCHALAEPYRENGPCRFRIVRDRSPRAGLENPFPSSATRSLSTMQLLSEFLFYAWCQRSGALDATSNAAKAIPRPPAGALDYVPMNKLMDLLQFGDELTFDSDDTDGHSNKSFIIGHKIPIGGAALGVPEPVTTMCSHPSIVKLLDDKDYDRELIWMPTIPIGNPSYYNSSYRNNDLVWTLRWDTPVNYASIKSPMFADAPLSYIKPVPSLPVQYPTQLVVCNAISPFSDQGFVVDAAMSERDRGMKCIQVSTEKDPVWLSTSLDLSDSWWQSPKSERKDVFDSPLVHLSFGMNDDWQNAFFQRLRSMSPVVGSQCAWSVFRQYKPRMDIIDKIGEYTLAWRCCALRTLIDLLCNAATMGGYSITMKRNLDEAIQITGVHNAGHLCAWAELYNKYTAPVFRVLLEYLPTVLEI